jgi:hypothetical protein
MPILQESQSPGDGGNAEPGSREGASGGDAASGPLTFTLDRSYAQFRK